MSKKMTVSGVLSSIMLGITCRSCAGVLGSVDRNASKYGELDAASSSSAGFPEFTTAGVELDAPDTNSDIRLKDGFVSARQLILGISKETL